MGSIKRKIAGILAAAMMISSCNISAHTQTPHTKEKSAEVSFNISADAPRVKISFDEVNNSDEPNTSGYIVKYQSTYEKNIYSSTDIEGKNTINLGENGTLQTEGTLKPGQLYKYWVVPYHIDEHTEASGEKVYTRTYASDSDCVPGYFVTEFDTKAQLKKDDNGQQQLQVVTQYIPDATYEIYYAKSKIEQEDIDKATLLTTISSNTYHDGKGNVVYTLPNPEMGTEYSFYVKVTGIATGDIFKGTISQVENILDRKTTQPQLAYAKVGTSVEITSVGKDYIKFSSKFSETFKANLEYVEVIRVDAYNQQHVIGEINPAQFQFNNSEKVYYMNFTYNRPEETTNYLVVFHFKDGTTVGDKVPDDILTYTPPDKVSEPMRPQVPSAANKEILDQINLNGIADFKDYFLKEDAILDNKKLNTISINDLFHGYIEDDKVGVQFIWSGQRKQGQAVQDPDITYDIWVFKDSIPKDYYDYEPLELQSARSEIYNTNKQVIGFKQNLTQYIDGSEIKDMVANSTYYIAVRSRNTTVEGKYSDATIVAITLDKNGEITQPAVLGKPPLRVQEENVTDKTIPIEWQTQWYELKAKDQSQYASLSETEQELAKQWNSGAYENSGTPKLRWTGNIEDRVGPFTQSFIQKYAADYLSRKITLEDDVKYEVKAISYDEVVQEVMKKGEVGKKYYTTTPGALRVENWIRDYENKSQTDADFSKGWIAVNPTEKESDKNWLQTTISQYTDINGNTKELEANKRYIIMVRTYRTVNKGNGPERLYQDFPSYVVGITKTDFKEPPIKPNAPLLYPEGVTSNSVSVWWTYNQDFEYEIRYSRLEDPENAETWEFTISNNPNDKNYVANGGKAVVTITGLSPETTYNVWIRAKRGEDISGWSNGVTLKTTSLDAPDAPRGLGLASNTSLLEIGKDMNASGSDYLTVEWMRIDEDVNNTDENIVYDYLVEFADNKQFLDAVSLRTGEKGANTSQGENQENTTQSKITSEVFAKNIVHFGGLDANKDYYVKVKTILTYTDPNNQKVIIKESEFTAVVRLKTLTSSGEYDGGDNQNIVIYPEAVVETYKNGIWTYEIVDAAKITTQILQANQFYYTITLENYKGKHDAVTRSLKMPVKVMSTLANRGMTLQVVTNIATYEIPGEALKSYINQYEGTDKVQLDFTRKSYSDITTYVRSYPEEYQSGEVLKIEFKGNARNTVVNTLNTNMKVKLKLDVATSYNYTNFNTYLYNYSTGNWEPQTYQVDTSNNKYLTYSTMYTGLHALYARKVETSSINSSYLMNALTSTYNITGLGTIYTQGDDVKASQYVKLMLGIAEDSKDINLSQGATSADYAAAKASGIYISRSTGDVTREQALAGVVRLYEIKKGYKIKPSNRSFNNVSATYKEAVSKAYAVGMIESFEDAQETVTYGQLCDWIALAID